MQLIEIDGTSKHEMQKRNLISDGGITRPTLTGLSCMSLRLGSYYCDKQRSSFSKESLCTPETWGIQFQSYWFISVEWDSNWAHWCKTLLWKHNREATTKGWTRRRSPGELGELLIKLVVFTCFHVMFSLTASLSVYFTILLICCIK